MGADIVFLIAILVVSVIIHEVSHGFAANWLGDPTARLEGRLTLNPVSHIDPMGSVIFPILMFLSTSATPFGPFVFGWAKPVPYNPYNLQRGGRWAEAIVAGAGPLANVVIAVLFSILIRLDILPHAMVSLAVSIVFLNVLLAIFNLLPIPPLDGSKVFPRLLPTSLAFQYERLRSILEQNIFLGFGIVIIFILVFGGWFATLITGITRFLIGA